MTERRPFRWVLTSTRVVVGAAIAVATVIVVGIAIAFPWPMATAEPVRLEATPAPSDTVLACDGPLLALGRVVEQAGQLSVAADQSVVSGPASAGAAEFALTTAAEGSQPLAFSVAADASGPASFAAAGSSAVEAADLRGFAASPCRPPLLESWLVGGATTTGSGDLLLLSNPGAVAATVEVTVYGAAGPVVAPGGSDRVVAAGSQVVVPLAGLLPDEASPVISVTAVGAPVTAALQSSLIRTLEPGGVDQVSPVAAASERQIVAGVVVAAEEADAAAGARTITRLLAPTADTQATVSVRDSDGRRVGEDATVPLTAGIPSELGLPGLAAGTYTVIVDADAPLVAGAWSTTGFGEGSDFGWFAAAPQIDRPTVVAVPTGLSPVLTLVNDGAEAVTVTLTSPSGTSREVQLPAEGAAEVALAESGVHAIDPAGSVHAAVSFGSTGALAGFPVWGADAAAPPIVIFP